MRLALTAFVALLAAASVLPVQAQTPDDFAAAEAAYSAAWDQLPLTFRNYRFVTAATGYGAYTDKADAVFKSGEPVVVYAEPLGFGFLKTEDGQNKFGFDFDFNLKSKDGTVLTDKQKFLHVDATSHAENHEFYVTLTLNLTGAPAGDYVLEYTGHDMAKDQSGTFELPFTIAP